MMKQYCDKEWLYQKYEVEKLSTNDIAKICLTNGRTISFWLKKFDIKARPFGLYEKNDIEKARQGMINHYKEFGHHLKGKIGAETNGWKGGNKWLGKNGYHVIWRNNKKMLYHVYVWLEHNKLTEVPKGHIIHHKDLNKENNDIENLVLMKWGKHIALHREINGTKRKKNLEPHINSKGFLIRYNEGKTILIHNELYCEYHNISSIPEGFVVHHIDGNRINNDEKNLLLMKWGKHIAYHRKLNGTGWVKKYSEEELLQKLKDYFTEYKKIPIRDTFHTYSKLHGSLYHKYFGSWNKALIKAGLTLNIKGCGKEFTKEELIEKILKVFPKPVGRRAIDNNKELPDSSTFRKYFGSWNNAKKEIWNWNGSLVGRWVNA